MIEVRLTIGEDGVDMKYLADDLRDANDSERFRRERVIDSKLVNLISTVAIEKAQLADVDQRSIVKATLASKSRRRM